MRAIEIYRPAELADLIITDQPLPSPAAHQVLIKVVAAGVNRPDLMQRKGLYPPPPGASAVLGLEVSGIIEAIGSEVTEFTAGDPVCALLTGGGYAEYCLTSASCCLPIPKGLSFIQAAALPETFFTVWSNLFDRAKLQAGESLLVHGGTSGIGTTAIQIGKAFGSRVIVTAGSEEKCQYCQKLGADLAINYRQQDFVAAVLHHTDNRGVDVVLDIIGGDYLPRNLKCLAIDGRLQQIAIQHGGKSEINLASVLMKRLTISGTTLRPRSDDFKAKIARQLFAKVWPLLEAGQLEPIIDSVFPLTKAAEAHERMESSQHIGKIILEI
ncbi:MULTISPECIES: NAD(P)H-quinone oxidoreductase [Methylomonas]|uniref:NAD(P)H-quinone oxidoreductase n=2 Tax=Methylomonas TaxID=416 RepID=A0A126T7W2_9GAMM|nr:MULTISPECIES: NAD(P)H-quinone oxidoreductase [Methylomonas]AMK78183.1 NAD(P)H-quinone oxidoreductase [Methylomonas denitrificans]OAI03905.1 NAD(P)H-quinone oxidoreductase [Methylomonas methanica]TCV87789.1 putative PIG3 family NAD(P)H quinone oxidoreductase [Methylomonas methanica]